jgi:adenine-specific DNA-methyltransferase
MELAAGNVALEAIRRTLGAPFFEAPGVLLYEGDCLDLMKRLPQGLLALTVTSPPYNIGKEYEAQRPLAEYLDWSLSWITEIFRLTQAGGAFWLNLGYVEVPNVARAVPIPYLLWNRVPFYLIQEIVWNYGAGVACRASFSPRNEKFLWYVKDPTRYTFNLEDVRDPSVKYPNQKKNGKLKCNPLGKNPTDVWQIPKVTSGENRASPERTAHPAQFPVALIDRIIRASSHSGELVFDPFLGSGSTAVACLRSGRPVVGFELNAGYLQLALERINREFEEERLRTQQGELFAG